MLVSNQEPPMSKSTTLRLSFVDSDGCPYHEVDLKPLTVRDLLRTNKVLELQGVDENCEAFVVKVGSVSVKTVEKSRRGLSAEVRGGLPGAKVYVFLSSD
jgi:hypothetical protein